MLGQTLSLIPELYECLNMLRISGDILRNCLQRQKEKLQINWLDDSLKTRKLRNLPGGYRLLTGSRLISSTVRWRGRDSRRDRN